MSHGGSVFGRISEFEGYKVKDWVRGASVNAEEKIIFHLGNGVPYGYESRRGYPGEEDGIPGYILFEMFNSDPNICNMRGLSIGAIYPGNGVYRLYFDDPESFILDDETFLDKNKPILIDEKRVDQYEESLWYEKDRGLKEFCNNLILIKDKFKNLECLIIGNYFFDDYDHIVIEFDQMKEILEAFPNLKHLALRGRIRIPDKPMKHEKLQTLKIDTLGIMDFQIEKLLRLKFPKLLRFEINIGKEHWRNEYTGTVDNDEDLKILKPLLSGKLYPKLKYLAITDCDFVNDLVYELACAPITKHLEYLDVSNGALTDEAAELLLNSPEIAHLKTLDLSDHFCSKECTQRMLNKAKEIGLNLIMRTSRQPRDLQYRYSMIRE